jgi:hypothetical protein
MTEEIDVLLKLWEQRVLQIRHIESQVNTITNFVIVISTAVIAYYTSKKIRHCTL